MGRPCTARVSSIGPCILDDWPGCAYLRSGGLGGDDLAAVRARLLA